MTLQIAREYAKIVRCYAGKDTNLAEQVGIVEDEIVV